MEQQNKVTQPYKGMVQDASPLHQPEGTYSFALNAVKDSDNNQNVIVNEEGLTSKFITPAGSTCIGSCYVGDNTTLAIFLDVIDSVDFILYNDNQITAFGEDVYSGANTLSFDTKHPLDITFRLRKGNQRTIYFTDGINPPRYINLDNINIVSLTEELVMAVIPYAEKKNLNLIFDTNEEVVMMKVDVSKIERVILNLVSNAIKFSTDNGNIFVTINSLDKYLEITVYNGLLQSAASELGARMTAMTSATDNAGELIDSLGLEYNKLRQSSITNEISEIVGGANALQ